MDHPNPVHPVFRRALDYMELLTRDRPRAGRRVSRRSRPGGPRCPRARRRRSRGRGRPCRPRRRGRASRRRGHPAPHAGSSSSDGTTRALSTGPAQEADVDLLRLVVAHRQCSPCAGCTISVSTPPVAAGCRKATREPRMPVRGVLVDQPHAGGGAGAQRLLHRGDPVGDVMQPRSPAAEELAHRRLRSERLRAARYGRRRRRAAPRRRPAR